VANSEYLDKNYVQLSPNGRTSSNLNQQKCPDEELTDPRKFTFDTVTLTDYNSHPSKVLGRSTVNEDEEKQRDLSAVNYCSGSDDEYQNS